jgi:hypothetical protein
MGRAGLQERSTGAFSSRCGSLGSGPLAGRRNLLLPSARSARENRPRGSLFRETASGNDPMRISMRLGCLQSRSEALLIESELFGHERCLSDCRRAPPRAEGSQVVDHPVDREPLTTISREAARSRFPNFDAQRPFRAQHAPTRGRLDPCEEDRARSRAYQGKSSGPAPGRVF